MVEEESLPRGLLAWMRFLWSGVLFPGQDLEDGRIRLSSLLILLVLPAILLYPTRSFLLLEPDEGRYAEIAREMLERGEWIVPTLQGQPYLDKPPLLYWLTLISYSTFGISESSARLPSALAVHAAILLVYLVGRRSLGERAAWWGALLLTVAPGFIGMGRLLLLDGLLTFFVTLSIFTAFEAVRGDRLRWGWWLAAALACGLGVLTKGPVAVLLLAPPLVGYRWLNGQAVWPGRRSVAGFAAVALLVNLPWYLAIARKEPTFLRYFLWEHNVMRFFEPFDHPQPLWYYVPIVLAGLLPGTLLLWAYGRYLLDGNVEVSSRRTAASGFFLIAGMWCIAFFSISGCKLPTYILPAFPCLSLALGHFIAQTRWDRSIWSKAGIGAAAVFLIFANYVAVPWYARQRSPMADRDLIARYCGNQETPVICFPRNVDSVAFYLGRDDLHSVRSKASQTLVEDMVQRPRTVVLFTHRHSLATLKEVLPPHLRLKETVTLQRPVKGFSIVDALAGSTPWGLCDIAVFETRP